MDVQVDTKAAEVIVKGGEGASVQVREWFAGCAYTGDLADGERREFADGCTAERVRGLVVWTER